VGAFRDAICAFHITISGCFGQGMEAAKAASEAAEAAVAAEQEAVEELRGRAAKLDAEVAELRKAAVKQNDAGGLPQFYGCCLPDLSCVAQVWSRRSGLQQ